MSDDLVKRLRVGIHTSTDPLALTNEAADRIEALEAEVSWRVSEQQATANLAKKRRDELIARAEAAEARAAELEKALDDLVMACELPGDHCELQPSLDRARAALARKEKDQ